VGSPEGRTPNVTTKFLTTIFFTHFSCFQPTQSLLPSSPSSPLPSSRPLTQTLLPAPSHKRNENLIVILSDRRTISMESVAKPPPRKKIFLSNFPGRPNGSPGGLCPPPGECLKHCRRLWKKQTRSSEKTIE
jgi:hypothetical protein